MLRSFSCSAHTGSETKTQGIGGGGASLTGFLVCGSRLYMFVCMPFDIRLRDIIQSTPSAVFIP